jgi:hypothetical protein
VDRTGPVEVTPQGVRYANGLEIRSSSGKVSSMPRQRNEDADNIEIRNDDGKGDVWVKFVGTEGWSGAGRWYLRTNPPSLARLKLGPNDIHLYASDNHHENWLSCIRTRREPIASAATSHRAMSIPMIRGIPGSRTLGWNPDREVFVGENANAANRFLSRPYREPWQA